MSLVTILITIPTVIFRKHIFIDPPDAKAVIIIIGLVLFAFIFLLRLFKQMDTYDIRDEPLFVQNFIEDCCRSDNRLEKDYKIAKQEKMQQKKEIAQQKKEVIRKKQEVKERIDHRSDILDL
jgi:hypothetical protein